MQPIDVPDETSSRSPDTSSTASLPETFDFVIIGGGTAGLVIASRLTEDPSLHVLVLEAGANRLSDPKILVPGLALGLFDDPDYDWCFSTVPQKELNNRIIPYQRGKVLGGSSAINLFQMVYNSKSGIDAWEEMGNPGWNSANLLPYSQKFHSHQSFSDGDTIAQIAPISKQEYAVESKDGPIQTSFSETGQVDKAWYETWQNIISDLGYEGDDLGGFIHPCTIDPNTKQRSYAASEYYSAEVASRLNLRLVTEALVERIIFSGDSEIVAEGVEFSSKSGEMLTIKARKEVILSAGTVQSPQLLETSGIGSPEILASHNIAVIVNNPNVGENLTDHYLVPVCFEAADGIMTGETLMRNPEIMTSLLEMYEKDRSGPLGHMFVDVAQCRLPETFGKTGEDFIGTLLSRVDHKSTSPAESLREEITTKLLGEATAQQCLAKFQYNIGSNSKITDMITAATDGNYLTIFTALNHPFSRGNIHISSANPRTPPIIDPGFLSHPADIEILARHVQFLPTIISTPPLSTFFKPGGRRIPSYAFKNEQEISLESAKRLVREQALSNYHPCGTCAMGRRDMGGVVDERLRVYGVRGLRVIDASVFPIIPRGNIMSSVYAVAERGADLIKEDWKHS